jgi:cell division transport system ATP-binding protein
MQPIIDLQNVDIFQKNNLVLGRVSVQIYKGEFVYLTGKTGTGKSSLLKILYADIPPQGTKAEVTGMNLLTLKSKQIPVLRKKLGIVFQDFQLLSDRSVNENLIFVMKATGWTNKVKIQERIDKVLNDVGLGTKGFKMPHQLSGGEQQRVCIARALINNPEIILADEPTGNLDPETSAEIMVLFHEISKQHNCTVLMATHDFVMIDKFPARTLRCVDGKVTGPQCDLSTLKIEEEKPVVIPEPVIEETKPQPIMESEEVEQSTEITAESEETTDEPINLTDLEKRTEDSI